MTITNMKRNIRNGLFKTSLLGVALVAATSCSDWTEVESLELNAPTLESQIQSCMHNTCNRWWTSRTQIIRW